MIRMVVTPVGLPVLFAAPQATNEPMNSWTSSSGTVSL